MANSPVLLLGGAGKVSNQWQGGFSGAVGAWFYPAELGFIGAIYVYGLVIFLILTGFSLYLAGSAIRSSANAESSVILALRWMTVFFLIRFVTGEPLLEPTPLYFTVFACLALSRLSKQTDPFNPARTTGDR